MQLDDRRKIRGQKSGNEATMICIGIDPGPLKTGFVKIEYENARYVIFDKGVLENEAAIDWLKEQLRHKDAEVAIEFLQSYGIAGDSLFQTAAWAGEFRRVAKDFGVPVFFHSRPKVASYITGTKWKDSLVRAALIQRIGGTKKGEPLHGVTSHILPALATAAYHVEGAVLGRWSQSDS